MGKTDNNEKIRSKTKQTVDRLLSARDIIPGAPKNNSEKIEQATNIPKFDLAEEILAEQRKITSIKRKAPCKRFETPRRERGLESIGFAVEQSNLVIFEQEQIIAEIVARDIEKSCRRSTFGALQ